MEMRPRDWKLKMREEEPEPWRQRIRGRWRGCEWGGMVLVVLFVAIAEFKTVKMFLLGRSGFLGGLGLF